MQYRDIISEMTADDKNAQIGAAVTEYQAAKTELGHIRQRVEQVFKTYREIGNTMDSRNRSPVEPPTIVDGKLKFGWFTPHEINTADLLNETDLKALAVEYAKALQRVENAKATMGRLGVNV